LRLLNYLQTTCRQVYSVLIIQAISFSPTK